MGDIPILNARKFWTCPNCTVTDVTDRVDVHTQMHQCAGLGGLLAPLIDTTRTKRPDSARIRPVIREDYVGKEHGLTYDDGGRPISSVVTEYADGSNDVAVFAPSVKIEMRQ